MLALTAHPLRDLGGAVQTQEPEAAALHGVLVASRRRDGPALGKNEYPKACVHAANRMLACLVLST